MTVLLNDTRTGCLAGLALPLLLKFFDNVLGREVEVNLGGQQRVMAQQALQRLLGDAFLDCRDGKGVSEAL